MKSARAVALSLIFLLSDSAHARVTLLGGLTATRDQVSVTGHDATSGTGFGNSYGITLEKLLASGTIGLEIGAFLTNKDVVTVVDGFRATKTWLRYAEMPALLRIWITRGFSIGAGGYFARGLGPTFEENYLTRNDLGAVGSASLAWRLGALGFVLDARYAQGVTTISRSLFETHRLRTAYLLGGLQLSL